MSWSVQLIGRPPAVAQALQEHNATLNGQSKAEFDDALPHLLGLVEQNFATEDSSYIPPVIQLEGSGSGVTKDGVQEYRTLIVTVKQLYGKLV